MFTKNPDIQRLIEKSRHITYMRGILALLEWDQEVMMPRKAGFSRSQQMSIISELSHNALTDKENGKLIDRLVKELTRSPEAFTPSDKALVREFKRTYDRETKLPVKFVKELTEHTSQSLETWREAREKKDFSIFEKDLQKSFELARQKADYYGYTESPYDALLDLFEQGLTESKVKSIFEPLKEFTKKFVTDITASNVKINNDILHRNYPIDKQLAFNNALAEGIGYDFEAGRLDKSTHPFTTEFGTSTDVRITTRFYENEVNSSVMATIHEVGHALYEQGISHQLDATIIGTGVSLGIHESQSRMWENFVGRTPEFWAHWFPTFASYFSDVVNVDEQANFVKALNMVSPSFIRVEADEVTYNLHIILRFELECALVKGDLKVKDLPEAWNAKMQEYLGATPPDDSKGVLQDIHWATGGIGYFPTYTLGNLYAAQFWATIQKQIPNLRQEISKGNTDILLKWLREKLHVYGSVYTPAELCEMISGESLNPEYLKSYLKQKFGTLYNLN